MEYWRSLGDVLVIYYQRRRKIERQIRLLQESLVWVEADKRTEIERLKRCFALPFEPVLADRRTRDELFQETIDDLEFKRREQAAGYIRGRLQKVRPSEVVPEAFVSALNKS